MNARLSVSIVYFDTPQAIFEATLASLGAALEAARAAGDIGRPATVSVIGNAPLPIAESVITQHLGAVAGLHMKQGLGNVGYGRGNNVAITQAASDFHLVLNPDVTLDPRAISAAIAHMSAHAACVCITPNTVSAASGVREYLAKSPPSLGLLALRGFAPAAIQARFAEQLAAYELRHRDYNSVFAAPIASGAFMFCRTAPLKQIDGFDPAYFLYFEDFDLSRRLSTLGEIHYVPSVKIAHAGGGAARKGLRHVLLFARSAARYFWARQ
jgi:GT2 family glycosyltransferase